MMLCTSTISGFPGSIPSSARIGARRSPNAAICSGESQTWLTRCLLPDPKQISNSSPSAGKTPSSFNRRTALSKLSRQRRRSEPDKCAHGEPPCWDGSEHTLLRDGHTHAPERRHQCRPSRRRTHVFVLLRSVASSRRELMREHGTYTVRRNVRQRQL